MKVFEVTGPLAAAILARLMANAAEGEDVGCECPNCTAARTKREEEASAKAAAEQAMSAVNLTPVPEETTQARSPYFERWQQKEEYTRVLNMRRAHCVEQAFMAGMRCEATRAWDMADNRRRELGDAL